VCVCVCVCLLFLCVFCGCLWVYESVCLVCVVCVCCLCVLFVVCVCAYSFIYFTFNRFLQSKVSQVQAQAQQVIAIARDNIDKAINLNETTSALEAKAGTQYVHTHTHTKTTIFIVTMRVCAR